MTDANPNPNEEWRNYIGNNPSAQANIPIVILDEEEPEEADPSEEYVPYGHDGEFDSDPERNAGEIPQDAQNPAESVTDEVIPPPPSPQPMSCCPEGNCPLTRRTARMSVPPVPQRDELGFVPFPFRAPQPYRHFEVGGPSRAPPPAVAPSPPPAVAPSPPPVVAPSPPPAPAVTLPQDAPTMEQHIQVVNHVLLLEDKRTEDSNAIQTLYFRVNTMRAHIRALEYRLENSERELRSSEGQRLQMRGELAELTRFVRRRLG